MGQVVIFAWSKIHPAYPTRMHFLEAMRLRGGLHQARPPKQYLDYWGHKVWFDWDARNRDRYAKYWHSTGPNGIYGDDDDVRFLFSGWDLSHDFYASLAPISQALGLFMFLPLVCCLLLRPLAWRYETVCVVTLAISVSAGVYFFVLVPLPVLDYWGTPPIPTVVERFVEASISTHPWLPLSIRRTLPAIHLAIPAGMYLVFTRLLIRRRTEICT